MKKTAVFLVLACFVPVLAAASTFGSGPTFTLPQSGSVEGNLYAGGGTVNVLGAVGKDILAGGGNVLISGTTFENVMAGGGSVVVNGPVGKDARLGGGTVSINGPVGGELLMGGGTLEVGRDAVVGGDAYLAGGQITVSGAILGGVRLAGQEVYLNGPIGGNVVVRAQKLSIGPRAVIAGDLKYQAAAPAQISSGAQVRGATNFTKISAPARYSWGRTLAMLGLTWLFKLLAAVAAVLVIFFLFPSLSAKFAVRSTTDFWRELARGLVILIVAPILVLILFASVVGAGVALILLAAYILFIIVAWVMSAFTMAGVLSKYVFRRGLSIDWQILVLSVAVIFVLGLIPVLGWLIAAAFFLVAFGTLCKIQFTELRS